MLTINPIAPGAFKIAVDPVYTADLTDDDDDTDDALTPVFFEIMSVNSPQIVGKNNAASQMAATAVALQLRDKTLVVPDALKDLNTFFTDRNDVLLTYRAEADKVGGTARNEKARRSKGRGYSIGVHRRRQTDDCAYDQSEGTAT